HRRTQQLVDGYSVVERYPRGLKPGDVGPDPDRGHDLVGRQPAAAGQAEPAILNGLDALAYRKLDPGAGIPARRAGADLGADRGRQRRGTGLDDVYRALPGRRGGGQLGADPAGPNDRQPKSWPQQLTQLKGVFDRPQE